METTDKLVLVFNTSLGKTRTVNIPNPVESTNAFSAEFAAERFITANPFDETVGSLEKLNRAVLFTKNVTKLF